jgi:protein-tyrosine phosphatase
MRILMVCLGNICRSPLAEGILQHKIDIYNLPWQVDSAGTASYHVGEAPHPLSQKIAKQNGINISNQRCRKFVAEDFLRFDKIYAMDTENFANIKKMGGRFFDANKADLILNETHPMQNFSIPDPWYGTEKDYVLVFEMLDKACEAMVKKYKPS